MEPDNVLEEGRRYSGGGVRVAQGDEVAYLDSQSTTVRITVLPSTFGNPSTKSIAMSCHIIDGTSSGYNSPIGCKCSVLWRWQVV
jgi:hypothetical protein